MVFSSEDGNLDNLAAAVFKYVEALNKKAIAYNILFTKLEVIVLPRQYERPNQFGAGTAVLEMSGEFIVFDQKTADEATEEGIWKELADTTISKDQFDDTIASIVAKRPLGKPVVQKNADNDSAMLGQMSLGNVNYKAVIAVKGLLIALSF